MLYQTQACPNNSGLLHPVEAPRQFYVVRGDSPLIFSRIESSASSISIVMIPLLCPEWQGWIDAKAFGLVRFEGYPTENLSFWVGKPHITQTFDQFGEHSLLVKNQSIAEAKILGKLELTISSSKYILGTSSNQRSLGFQVMKCGGSIANSYVGGAKRRLYEIHDRLGGRNSNELDCAVVHSQSLLNSGLSTQNPSSINRHR